MVKEPYFQFLIYPNSATKCLGLPEVKRRLDEFDFNVRRYLEVDGIDLTKVNSRRVYIHEDDEYCFSFELSGPMTVLHQIVAVRKAISFLNLSAQMRFHDGTDLALDLR